MRELSIEEKARYYDRAIAKAKEHAIDGYLDAVAVDDIFFELKENKDEEIRKRLLEYFKSFTSEVFFNGVPTNDAIAWLEKQGEHANFRNKIQIGDKVTRNKDGVLVNLSQLKRVAKKDKKQGEQKPTKWSEKDETNLRRTEYAVMKFFGGDCSLVGWLRKSLRPHSQWKPSDEQMEALRYVTNFDYGGHKATLVSLYEQLKKLRGE